MVIHFLDGGYAECSEIEVIGDQIYWDGYRYYPVYEIDWIEDDDGSDITMDYLGSIYGSTRKFTKYPQGYVKANTYSLSDYQIVGFTPDEYERLKRVVGNNYSFTDDTFGYIKSPDGAFSIDISAVDAPDVGVIPEWTVFQLDVKDNGTTYNEDIDIGTLDISLSYDEQVDYLIARLEDTIRYMH